MRDGRWGSGQPAPPSAPPSSSTITWLVLSWLSVVLTVWPPGGSRSQMPHHIWPGSGPQSFSHPRPSPTHISPPSSHPLDATWKWEPFVYFCLFIALTVSAVRAESENANIKQYNTIILHSAPAGTSSIFVICLETRTSAAAYSNHTA